MLSVKYLLFPRSGDGGSGLERIALSVVLCFKIKLRQLGFPNWIVDNLDSKPSNFDRRYQSDSKSNDEILSDELFASLRCLGIPVGTPANNYKNNSGEIKNQIMQLD